MTVRENLELGARTRAARGSRAETLERVFELFPRLRERGAQLAGTLSATRSKLVRTLAAVRDQRQASGAQAT